MALRGNLRDFTITQLLNLVNLAKKTGTLIVDGPSDQAFVSFRDGKLAYAHIGKEDGGLATVLHNANKLNAYQYQTICQRGGAMNDKELGILLINAGYVSQEDILLDLQNACEDVMRRLFTWVEGLFRFENGLLPPDDRIMVKVDLENLIIEGSRKLREIEHLEDEIPSLGMALKFTERPLSNINLSRDEWQVVKYVDPKNTMKQIASTVKLNDLEMRRIVYSLLQAGLVRMLQPSTTPRKLDPRMFPMPEKKEQKSLINKIIGRIQRL